MVGFSKNVKKVTILENLCQDMHVFVVNRPKFRNPTVKIGIS